MSSQTESTSEQRLQLRTSVAVSSIILIGAVLEIFKDVGLAFRYGAGKSTDVFFAALLVPNTYGMFWISACLIGLVPLFAVWFEREARERRRELLGGILAFSIAFALVLALALYITAPVITYVLVPGFSAAQRGQTVDLFRKLTLLIVVDGFSGIAAALLNSRRNFLVTAANKTVTNLTIVIGLFVLYIPLGVEWLADLFVYGRVGYAAILLFRLWQLGLRPRLSFGLERWRLRTLMVGILAPLAVMPIRYMSIVAERAIASFLAVGSISVLTYGYRLIDGSVSIISAGLSVVIIPTLAVQRCDEAKLRFLRQGSYYLLIITTPLACGFYLMARPLVAIMLQHGSFQSQAAAETAAVMKAYAFGALFSAWGPHFQSVYWAERRYKVLISHNTMMMLINVLLDLALVPLLGVVGLAIGYSLSSLISCVRMFRLVRRDYGPIFGTGEAVKLLKPVAASLIMCLVVVWARTPIEYAALTKSSLPYSDIVRLGVIGILGAGTYLCGAIVLRIEPFPTMLRTIYYFVKA
jgi:putative peptidoglycan lipid II flippase